MNKAQAKGIEDNVAAEIAALRGLSVGELQERYLGLFGHESRSRNRDWLFKRIAYRLQEVRHGGLSERARRRAQELAKDGYLRRLPPADFDPGPSVLKQPHPKDPRLPAVGTVLTKEHGGELHEITVLEDGFAYRGQTYPSLSRIAKHITGTPWNGFVWLGLDKRKRVKKEPAR